MSPKTASPTPPRRARLRRSDCSGKGLTRIKRGHGFSYADAEGKPIKHPEEILRVRKLGIPPAWQEVWICPDPLGHLQATGIDAAGRKQYLYHPRWRELRDREKFDRMLSFARLLPRLRKRVLADLDADGLDEQRVLACAVRLLDVGMFRIGSEERRVQAVQDAPTVTVVQELKRRRAGGSQLLAYRERGRWHRLRSEQITDYLKAQIGEDYSAKDFRTWNATVLAAVSVAADGREARSVTARERAINGAVKGVATVLGNTPAVARRAYIDPRVFDHYLSGWTIGAALDRIGGLAGPDDRRRARLETAVLDLLDDPRDSAAVERMPTKKAA
jgi:DNA topoisomerase IB